MRPLLAIQPPLQFSSSSLNSLSDIHLSSLPIQAMYKIATAPILGALAPSLFFLLSSLMLLVLYSREAARTRIL